MPRRRKVRRFNLETLTPELRAGLLSASGAPRWIIARAGRAVTNAQVSALLHPARWPGGRVPFNS